MAKLKDLVNVNINRDNIVIQGKEIPVIFTMKAFPFVEEAYGKPYPVFEADLNRMRARGDKLQLGKNETRLMYALVYGMVRAAGTECTPKELEGSIRIPELPDIFQKVYDIFNNQHFQNEDMAMIKQEKKS